MTGYEIKGTTLYILDKYENGNPIIFFDLINLFRELYFSKTNIKKIYFGPFLKGYIETEILDTDDDGYPTETREVEKVYGLYPLNSAPETLVEWEVDPRNETFVSVDGMIFLRKNMLLLNVPSSKKHVCLKKDMTFQTEMKSDGLRMHYYFSKNVKTIIVPDENVFHLVRAAVKSDVFGWPKQDNDTQIELEGHVGEYVEFYNEDKKIFYGINRAPKGGKVKIPEGVETVECYACADIGLKEVVFPASLKCIKSGAFRNCDLREINLPKGLIEIFSYAFENNDLREIDIPSKVKEVGSGAFGGNHNLTLVKMPNKLKGRIKSMFYDCKKLKKDNIILEKQK